MNSYKCPVCGNPLGEVPAVKGCTSYFLTGINEDTGRIDDCNGIPLKLYGCVKCGYILIKSPKLLNCSLVNE